MILPDYPIKNKDEDKLRRLPLAIKVADLFKNFESKESFVVGIEGVWGSGKTSFINLILNEFTDNDSVIFVNFNPWNFSGQNELINDFFLTLNSALKKESGLKSLSKILGSYTSKLQFSYSPAINTPIGSFSFGLPGRNGTTLQEEREKIDNQLKLLTKKIIVIIDDIDRLDADETQLIMKLVKMTANFPNTIFLLAYDRERVANKIDSKGWSGEEYLKKIVQVSFTLPEPDRQELQAILFEDLDKSIEKIYGEVKLEGENEKRWNEILYVGFLKLFRTIRDIKRYVGALRLNWSIVGKDDVNIVDFIVIEAIRVCYPKFYSAVGSDKRLFTEMRGYSGFSDKDMSARKAKYEEILGYVTENKKEIDAICKILFPQLENNGYYSAESSKSWRKDLRICSDEKFPFYFQLGVPKGAVSEIDVKALIKKLNKKEDFSKTILKFAKEKRLRQVLSKLLDYVDDFSKNQTKNLISTLWDLEKEIHEKRNAVFDFEDVETQTWRLVYHSTKASVPKNKRKVFFEGILKKCKTVYYPAHFISILLDEHKKDGKTVEPLLDEAEAQTLSKILLKRIKKMASDGTLALEENLAFFLFRWKEWENEDVVKNFIKESITTKEGLVNFLKAFVIQILSTGGNYKKLDKKAIALLYPLEEVEKAVNQITDIDMKSFNEKGREAVNYFKNPVKDHWGEN